MGQEVEESLFQFYFAKIKEKVLFFEEKDESF